MCTRKLHSAVGMSTIALPAYTRVMRRTIDGPVVRTEIGPCLDCDLQPDCDGYPRVVERGVRRKASRVVLEHSLGRKIRRGLCALHRCDRPSCVREGHIYEGTLKQNSADRDARTGNPFRRPDVIARLRAKMRGERHPLARLNECDVLNIRALYAAGLKFREMAAHYNVSMGAVTGIVYRYTWKHVA